VISDRRIPRNYGDRRAVVRVREPVVAHRAEPPPVKGKSRCRMHGGARGTGAPPGEKNGNYKTGRHTAKAKELSKLVRQVARDAEVAGDVVSRIRR